MILRYLLRLPRILTPILAGVWIAVVLVPPPPLFLAAAVIHKFVTRKYAARFPELEQLVLHPVDYIRTVKVSTLACTDLRCRVPSVHPVGPCGAQHPDALLYLAGNAKPDGLQPAGSLIDVAAGHHHDCQRDVVDNPGVRSRPDLDLSSDPPCSWRPSYTTVQNHLPLVRRGL